MNWITDPNVGLQSLHAPKSLIKNFIQNQAKNDGITKLDSAHIDPWMSRDVSFALQKMSADR
jgi:hypothetical protein